MVIPGETDAKSLGGHEIASEIRRRLLLLDRLVARVIAYDRSQDELVSWLRRRLERAGVDYEEESAHERIKIRHDGNFCRVREVLREITGDEYLLQC